MKIIVKDGVGREANPNPSKVLQDKGYFEYPAFAADGKTLLPDGEHEAKIWYQEYDSETDSWNKMRYVSQVMGADDIRGIYISIGTPDKTVEELAAERYPIESLDISNNFGFEEAIAYLRGNAFITGSNHTATTSGMVKKDEVVKLVKERISYLTECVNDCAVGVMNDKLNYGKKELIDILTQLEKL